MQLAAGLCEGQVSELVEDDEVAPGELVGGSALNGNTGAPYPMKAAELTGPSVAVTELDNCLVRGRRFGLIAVMPSTASTAPSPTAQPRRCS